MDKRNIKWTFPFSFHTIINWLTFATRRTYKRYNNYSFMQFSATVIRLFQSDRYIKLFIKKILHHLVYCFNWDVFFNYFLFAIKYLKIEYVFITHPILIIPDLFPILSIHIFSPDRLASSIALMACFVIPLPKRNQSAFYHLRWRTAERKDVCTN